LINKGNSGKYWWLCVNATNIEHASVEIHWARRCNGCSICELSLHKIATPLTNGHRTRHLLHSYVVTLLVRDFWSFSSLHFSFRMNFSLLNHADRRLCLCFKKIGNSYLKLVMQYHTKQSTSCREGAGLNSCDD